MDDARYHMPVYTQQGRLWAEPGEPKKSKRRRTQRRSREIKSLAEAVSIN
jgi:hypothetical protein